MNVNLSAYRDSATCTWCERDKCCVTVSFSDGFLKSADLCWRCLQKAFRVRSRQAAAAAAPPAERSKSQSAAPGREAPSAGT